MADDPTSTSEDSPEPTPDPSKAHDPVNPTNPGGQNQDTAQPGASAEHEGDAQPDELEGATGTATDLYAPPPDPYEGAVPPGYDWPTHGGYLGCLLGTMAACAISGFLGGTWFAILAAPSWVRLGITFIVAVAVFVGLGRLGWVLGKRFYREYPQPVRGVAAAPLASETPRADASPRD